MYKMWTKYLNLFFKPIYTRKFENTETDMTPNEALPNICSLAFSV